MIEAILLLNFLKHKFNFMYSLIYFFSLPFVTEKIYSQIEKQRYDGWYNNLAHPDWGSVGK